MENKRKIGILPIILGLIVVIVVALGGNVLSKRATIISLEETIEAQYVSNQSNYDQMVKSAKEMVQVTDMYAEDFERIYKGLIEGRYAGEQGQKELTNLFKLVQESNPTLDPEVYTTLQRELSANRKVFDNKQATMSDKVREYNTYVQKYFISASILNKSKKNISDFIVTSSSTNEVFTNGESEEINLRGE